MVWKVVLSVNSGFWLACTLRTKRDVHGLEACQFLLDYKWFEIKQFEEFKRKNAVNILVHIYNICRQVSFSNVFYKVRVRNTDGRQTFGCSFMHLNVHINTKFLTTSGWWVLAVNMWMTLWRLKFTECNIKTPVPTSQTAYCVPITKTNLLVLLGGVTFGLFRESHGTYKYILWSKCSSCRRGRGRGRGRGVRVVRVGGVGVVKAGDILWRWHVLMV